MRKVSVVVASRANYGRSKSILRAIHDSPVLELDLVICASALLYRFGDITDTVTSDGFIISKKIFSVVEGETHSTMVKSTALLMSELASHFEASKPHFVLTIADRHETLATAIAASYSNIPLVHTQGGEQTGSIDDKVRHAISKLANIHFPATSHSRDLLIQMGEDPSMVFNSGCPALDLIHDSDLSIDKLSEPSKGSGTTIDFSSRYGVIVYHPVTDNLSELLPVLHALIDFVSNSEIPYVWLWPNVDAGSDQISQLLRKSREKISSFANNVRFVRSYTPVDYLRVLKSSDHVIGNSSSFIRECSHLAIPALIVGERQRSREIDKNVRLISYEQIIEGNLSENVANLPTKESLMPSNLYTHCHAGKYIAEILSSISVDTRKKPMSLL